MDKWSAPELRLRVNYISFLIKDTGINVGSNVTIRRTFLIELTICKTLIIPFKLAKPGKG